MVRVQSLRPTVAAKTTGRCVDWCRQGVATAVAQGAQEICSRNCGGVLFPLPRGEFLHAVVLALRNSPNSYWGEQVTRRARCCWGSHVP